MVDVSAKVPQKRTAVAMGRITLASETIALITTNNIRKGNVLITAEIAGIQSAKHAGTLIPLCHPLTLTSIQVHADIIDNGVSVTSEVSCIGQTGVEMEALTAVNIALLTIYDMCKAVDKTMVISDIHLISKTKEPVL
jgi:cyclic pyranopterin phosphate synthase